MWGIYILKRRRKMAKYSDYQIDIVDPEKLIILIKKHHHWMKNETLQNNLENTIKCTAWIGKRYRSGYGYDERLVKMYQEYNRIAWSQIGKLRHRYEQRRQKFADLNSKYNKVNAELKKYKEAYGEFPSKTKRR